MTISLDKKYQTVGGRKVFLKAINKKTPDGKRSSYPVVGTVDFSDVNGIKKAGSKPNFYWNMSGKYTKGRFTKFDLVEIKGN